MPWDTTPYADYLCMPTQSTYCIWASPELEVSYIGAKSYDSYKIYTGISYTPSWDWVATQSNLSSMLIGGGDMQFIICPQLTDVESSIGIITSATCTTANPTVTYDY